ncbi:pseudouridine synthase pus4 [Dispira parvispora]|uniref:tRNA pseudouridine(55) synthase n=1 Tax=Dispira parvispora TaxID=1520584 RepID=A0A9W8AQG3_9FUNG|nr:pseudouridine synthase pus4 [Dispira parvispora]
MTGIQILNQLQRIPAYNGVLPLYKPYGLTSTDCLRYLNLAISHARKNFEARNGARMLGYDPLPSRLHFAGYKFERVRQELSLFPAPHPDRVTLMYPFYDLRQLDPVNTADLFLYTLLAGYPSKFSHVAKRKYRLKIGHGGTLDPLASGLLLVTFGDACQLSARYQEGFKTYVATGVLGLTTDSYDLDGNVVTRKDPGTVTKELLEATLRRFQGYTLQRPPVYSAIKLNGQRLSDYARTGTLKDFQPVERLVRIKSIKLSLFTTTDNVCDHSPVLNSISQLEQYQREHGDFTDNPDIATSIKATELPAPLTVGITKRVTSMLPQVQGLPIFRFEVEASGGTYVRSLVHDVGQMLGCGATLVDLVRTKAHDFELDERTPRLLQCRDPFFLHNRIVPYNSIKANHASAEF